MPRIKKEISKVELEKHLKELEASRTFRNQSELFKAVAATEWGRGLRLSPSIIYLRVQEFGLKIVTPKGKKGNLNNGTPRKKRKRKIPDKVVKALKAEAKYYGVEVLAERALGGSMKSSIKLNCIQCCGGERTEVRNCEVFSCSFWSFRPFQKSDSWEDEDESSENATI